MKLDTPHSNSHLREYPSGFGEVFSLSATYCPTRRVISRRRPDEPSGARQRDAQARSVKQELDAAGITPSVKNPSLEAYDLGRGRMPPISTQNLATTLKKESSLNPACACKAPFRPARPTGAVRSWLETLSSATSSRSTARCGPSTTHWPSWGGTQRRTCPRPEPGPGESRQANLL